MTDQIKTDYKFRDDFEAIQDKTDDLMSTVGEAATSLARRIKDAAKAPNLNGTMITPLHKRRMKVIKAIYNFNESIDEAEKALQWNLRNVDIENI